MSKKDAALFLKSLSEEGIEEVYIEKSRVSATAIPGPKAGSEHVPAKEKHAASSASSSEKDWMELEKQAKKCTLCPELSSKRTNVVFGSGNKNARLMFVGEAPGADEDEQGLPFVGAAGQLLTKIIESIQLKREDVYIANTLKCRPPGNRPPQPQEIENCNPFLQKQIELIKPEIICALGTHAAQTVLKTETPISRLRGNFFDLGNGTRVICTFHPAYLLRNPSAKRDVWEDMKRIRAELEKHA